MNTTGRDLRAERSRAGIKLKDLAARMGVHPATLGAYEKDPDPKAMIVDAYLAALASLREIANQGAA